MSLFKQLAEPQVARCNQQVLCSSFISWSKLTCKLSSEDFVILLPDLLLLFFEQPFTHHPHLTQREQRDILFASGRSCTRGTRRRRGWLRGGALAQGVEGRRRTARVGGAGAAALVQVTSPVHATQLGTEMLRNLLWKTKDNRFNESKL